MIKWPVVIIVDKPFGTNLVRRMRCNAQLQYHHFWMRSMIADVSHIMHLEYTSHVSSTWSLDVDNFDPSRQQTWVQRKQAGQQDNLGTEEREVFLLPNPQRHYCILCHAKKWHHRPWHKMTFLKNNFWFIGLWQCLIQVRDISLHIGKITNWDKYPCCRYSVH